MVQISWPLKNYSIFMFKTYCLPKNIISYGFQTVEIATRINIICDSASWSNKHKWHNSDIQINILKINIKNNSSFVHSFHWFRSIQRVIIILWIIDRAIELHPTLNGRWSKLDCTHFNEVSSRKRTMVMS